MNRYTAISSDVEEWYQHFKKMAEGKLNPSKQGLYLIHNSDKTKEKPSDSSAETKIELVSPSAQALEIAQSEAKHAADQPTDKDPITHFPSGVSEEKKRKRKYIKKSDPAAPIKKRKETWEKFIT